MGGDEIDKEDIGHGLLQEKVEKNSLLPHKTAANYLSISLSFLPYVKKCIVTSQRETSQIKGEGNVTERHQEHFSPAALGSFYRQVHKVLSVVALAQPTEMNNVSEAA